MRPVFFHAALVAFVVMAFSASVMADSAPAIAPSDKKVRMDKIAANNNPHAARLQEMAQALYNTQSKDESQRLVALRNGFGMVRAVEIVKTDITATVKLCDAANPSMKGDLDSRLAAWQNKVMPVVNDQEKRLQSSINKTNFSRPDDVRAFLDQLDKTAVYAKEQQDKSLTRITTPDACKSLAQSMDENGGKLVESLQKIRWPGDLGTPVKAD